MRIFVLFLVMLSACFQAATAQLLRVPADCPDIQSAIDRASPGDTVLVEEGRYFENINFRGKSILLASLFLLDGDTSHISRTIIDGSRYSHKDSASVVTLDSGEDSTSVLYGFTITGGRGSYRSGIVVDSAMEARSYIVGGGILIYKSGGRLISNIIENNQLSSRNDVRGSMGGGIYLEASDESEFILQNNIIRFNRIKGIEGWGGGLGILGGRVLLEHNVVIKNSINTEWLSVGGGIYLQNIAGNPDEKEMLIRNNVIAANSSNSLADMGIGSGLAAGFFLQENMLRIHHNLICNNSTNGIGGGFYCFESRAWVSENLIFNNRADMYGSSMVLEMENTLNMDYNHLWEGEIWIATHHTIHELKLADSYGRNFVQHSWNGEEAYSQHFSIDPSSGGIYIGERENMITFRPQTVPLNAFAPPVILLDFRHKQNTKQAIPVNRLLLSHERDFLKFKIAPLEIDHTCLLQYTQDDYQFRYFMKGVDSDTVITGMAMTARYRDLKPGRYSFWVGHNNPDGSWNPAGIKMDIIMRNPWYRSAIAYAAYALFLILLTTILIRFRTRRLNRERLRLEREVAMQTHELQDKNEQLLEMEAMRTRFFTDVSHEIRTPLSLIVGPLDQLSRQSYPDPRIKYWLSLIMRNSQRLLGMVNQLLDISRLDAGHMKMVLEESDLISHIRMVVLEFQSMADRKDISYIIDIPEKELKVFYDRDKMEKVLTNLLSNAFRFTPPAGIVTCRIKIIPGFSGNEQVRIIIADTGPGVPAMERDKIFERFFRGEKESGDIHGGTGIGLALTRELVQTMHGSVLLKSLEGKGSVFIVTLPLGKDHLLEGEYIIKDREPADAILHFHDIDGGRKIKEGEQFGEILSAESTRILLVEDNEELRAFMVESLQPEFQLLEAGDGHEGLELVRSEMPDLVISDVMMPGMDGLELCKQLKQDELSSHIPLILLTARSTSKDRIEGFYQGADDYIFKPFSNDELKTRIRNLLEQRDRLKKKYSGMVGMNWEEINVNNLDEKFLKKVIGIISEHLREPDFNVGQLQELSSISREHLYRKLLAITGESPSALIRKLRLKTAASLLQQQSLSVTEVCLHVGFSNPSHFARSFKKEYGVSPNQYRKEPVS